MGVTGTRESVSEAAGVWCGRVRAVTDLPVCVGIGISTAAQAADGGRFADGVIVESVLVKAILDAPDEAAGLAAVGTLTAELADGVRRDQDAVRAAVGEPARAWGQWVGQAEQRTVRPKDVDSGWGCPRDRLVDGFRWSGGSCRRISGETRLGRGQGDR